MDRWRFYAGRLWDGKQLLDGPVTLTATFVFEIPKSWSKRKRKDAALGLVPMTARPDIDNLGKLIKDALNTVVYQDDKQIVRTDLCKKYGPDPQTIIQISTEEETHV